LISAFDRAPAFVKIRARLSDLRPGRSVQVTVAGRSLSDARLLPRHAVFETEGEPVVYVSEDGVFAAQPVHAPLRVGSVTRRHYGALNYS